MAFRKSLKYAKISLRRREKLVNLTVLSNMSISKAARMLGLKPSTAKLIVKRYKQDGTFFESRSSKAKRLETSEVPQGLQFRADNIESHRNNEVSQVNQNEPILPSAVGCWESPQIPILMWSPEYQTYYWICLGGSFIGCQ